jgi:ketosteroid isomerase-like protein
MSSMTPADAARRWSETWQRAWESFDTEAIVALYATDAIVSTEPFREPVGGPDGVRSYVSRVFAEEENPRATMGSPIVDGDRAAVPWWASLREEGRDTTLAGISMLRFNVDGLVVEQWDTWNHAQDRRHPPEEWGPFAARS